MLRPTPNSPDGPRPEVVAADQRQKWEGSQRTGRQWIITLVIFVVILAVIIIGFGLIPQ